MMQDILFFFFFWNRFLSHFLIDYDKCGKDKLKCGSIPCDYDTKFISSTKGGNKYKCVHGHLNMVNIKIC